MNKISLCLTISDRFSSMYVQNGDESYSPQGLFVPSINMQHLCPVYAIYTVNIDELKKIKGQIKSLDSRNLVIWKSTLF